MGRCVVLTQCSKLTMCSGARPCDGLVVSLAGQPMALARMPRIRATSC